MEKDKASVNEGFCWHCYHDALLTYCYDYDVRAKYIREMKPQNEVGERLYAFQFVKGELPIEVVEAGKACNEKWILLEQASEAHQEENARSRTSPLSFTRQTEAHMKTKEAYIEAARVQSKAFAIAVQMCEKYKPAIEKLHAKECTDCTWDGNELIFENGE